MKTFNRNLPKILVFYLTITIFSACKEKNKSIDPIEDFKVAINDKYQNELKIKGYLPEGEIKITPLEHAHYQIYNKGGLKAAIYFFNKSRNGAFVIYDKEFAKYENLGQDKFAFITSDAKSCGIQCTTNDIELQDETLGLIANGQVVYGDILKKYKELSLWDGILGKPTTSEADLTTKRGRYNAFEKGQIYWSIATKAQAFWGKTQEMYAKTGYDTGWLGLPKSSLDPSLSLTKGQFMDFENGKIGYNFECSSYYFFDGKTINGVDHLKNKAGYNKCY
jgi:LGFP repeat